MWVLLLGIGCSSTESTPANLDPTVLAEPHNGYSPSVDVSWQWQLAGTLNTSYDVDLYDVDLFDTTTATIVALQGQGRRVICYFSAGSSEDWRDDFGDFNESDIGRRLGGWQGENWLDIRSANVVELMESRLDVAVEKGCDGVEPDNVDGYTNNTGFDLSSADQLAFNKHMANEAHLRGLAIGLKNDGNQAQELAPYFDFSLNEECHNFEECGQLAPFTDAGKPILNAEYPSGDPNDLASTVCPAAIGANLRTLILPLDLDDSFRISCDDR